MWGIVEVDIFWCLIVGESYYVQKLLERKCVCGVEHDGPYRYDGKINWDNNNLGERCCNQERHKKRNKNWVYKHYTEEEKAEKEKGTKDTQKYKTKL